MRLEVKESGDKGRPWGLFVNGVLFGASKARYDADFAMRALELAASKPIIELPETEKALIEARAEVAGLTVARNVLMGGLIDVKRAELIKGVLVGILLSVVFHRMFH